MGVTEVFLIAVSLAMDAFAVSLCRGLCMRKINYKHAFIIAGLFGLFQAAMPILGWLLGRQFEQYIDQFAHWVAFALLLIIGGKMIADVFDKNEDKKELSCQLNVKELLVMAVATSIDALAVGFTFAFLGASIWMSVSIIGAVTFAICFLGVIIGNKFGAKFKKKAQFAGGLVLVFIGIKILLQHLGVINF
ncbi:MAG: manganese efflux pump MntP family protein [Clostridia bacterium]|nr:manganese efflux pump MntP family protein [Clostridia bacterium]